MKKIVLTGGGTAGHVTPNLALLPSLQERGYEIHYIGSYNGIEKKLIENAGIPYDGISSGKLRRYFDIKNFSDPFRVIKGYAEARSLLKKYRPDVVSPRAALSLFRWSWLPGILKIPTIIHESDMTLAWLTRSASRLQPRYAATSRRHCSISQKTKLF